MSLNLELPKQLSKVLEDFEIKHFSLYGKFKIELVCFIAFLFDEHKWKYYYEIQLVLKHFLTMNREQI